MDITGEHLFKAPRATVWEAMLDPAALQASMPGCESFTANGPESYDITVKASIGPIKGGVFTGNVKVTDRNPQDSYRLVVHGGGKPGAVQGDAVMTLTEQAGGTLVSYAGDVRAQGAIARLGSRLLAGTAKLMIGQFMKAMEKQVQQRTV